MKKILFRALCACAATALSAQNEKVVLDCAAPGFDPGLVFAGNGPLSLEKLPGGVKITTQADPWWPGYTIAFPGAMRDLRDFGGIALDIENPENFAQNIGFRVDNPGADGQRFCNTEGYTLAAGERKTVSVWFGFTDKKPGFELDPANVVGACVFWNQPKQAGSFVVRGVKAIPPNPGFAPPPKPREHVMLKFDTAEAAALSNLRGGAFAGGKLTGDTMPEAKQWFEFWESRAGLLAGNYSYKIKFQYRVVDAAEGAVFYSLFRSQGKGWGKWDRGWTNIEQLPAKKGQTLTQEHTVDLPRFKDYFMMFGVNGRAKVEVDYVEITRGAPFADDGDLAERAAAKRNANAQPLIMADFENGLPETARVAVGEITDNPAEVLLGTKSLVVDTIGAGREWNEFFAVGRGKLEPGYTYFVTIPARMERKGAKGGSVYVAAAPLHEGENNGKIGWRSWNSAPGEDDIISTTF
ncbi:MAG: hypothetical protein FWF96_03260, partial [Kiritimatiellaeota bacterium]|nr:hypothetical protein [Kiritimatiellota bacterium]